MTATHPSSPKTYSVRRWLALLASPFLFPFVKSALWDPITIHPPAWLRLLLVVILITNARSLPFAWHIRVLWPAFKSSLKIQRWSFWSKDETLYSSSLPRLRLTDIPIGKDLFQDITTWSFIATLDECDFNGHLSNSSYARSLDYTRMSHLTPKFLRMFYDGGWVALDGHAFNFHREIPMLASYQVNMSVQAWDDKWLYIVGQFVSPTNTNSNDNINKNQAIQFPNNDKRDDSILYCTSVSRYCCKSGRRTIPPWLVLATSGYGTLDSTKSNWQKAETLRNNYVQQAKQTHQAKTGKPLAHDGFFFGDSYRNHGLLKYYRLESERKGSPDEDWMNREYWNLQEFEDQRKQGLETLSKLGGGILPPIQKN